MLDFGVEVFSVNEIRLHATGGSDMWGEWSWSGSYELCMSKSMYPVDYDYYASITRRYSRKGRSTIGWHVKMYLNMFYGHRQDILVMDMKVKTLKSVKEAIFNKMMKLKEDALSTKKMIEEWKAKHSNPVYGHDNETNELILIGTAYAEATDEFQNVDKLWFNDDIPNYEKHNLFYQLNRSSWSQEQFFSASKTEVVWGGYVGSSERNESLLNQMIELGREKKRYRQLFHDKKTLRCVNNLSNEGRLTVGKEYEVSIEHVNLYETINTVTDDHGETLQVKLDCFDRHTSLHFN